MGRIRQLRVAESKKLQAKLCFKTVKIQLLDSTIGQKKIGLLKRKSNPFHCYHSWEAWAELPQLTAFSIHISEHSVKSEIINGRRLISQSKRKRKSRIEIEKRSDN